MSILQRSTLFMALAGLGFAFSAPAFASDQPQSWSLNVRSAAAQPPRLAYLPPLPTAPRHYAVTPERRAFLNLIRYAEGTWANGTERGYWIMFGGSLMASLDRHPNRVNRTTGYASAAAGAYQFLPATWNMAVRALGIQGFDAHAQDQAALFLIQRRGALPMVDRGELTADLVARLAPEWASLPTLAGHSYYRQPVKRLDNLRRFYEWQLSTLRYEEQLRIAPPQDVAVAQPEVAECTDGSLTCRLNSVGPRPRLTPRP